MAKIVGQMSDLIQEFKMCLNEGINIPIVFYDIKKSEIVIEFEDTIT
jgi:hypothetical protein